MAALSFVLARNFTKFSPDKAMIAGLLHDIGKFYILSRACHYQDLFVSEATLWEVVDQWHVDIGAAILSSWEISDDICVAVMDHLSRELPVTGKPTLTDVVAAANFLDVNFVDQASTPLDWQNIPAALKNLQLDAEKTEKLMAETQQELASILKILA